MRKIYINESFLTNVVNGRLLPQFLFKLVKTHTTSLGDNDAFPTSDEYPFDYVLLKKRYNEVCDAIENVGLESLEEDYLVSELSSLVKKCKELETPIRDSLEKICENAVNKLFAIPSEMINISFKLVDKIKFKSAIRMRPESSDDLKYTFKDIADIDLSNKAIAKRRFIDSLIQGAAYIYGNVEGLYLDDIDKINEELPRLYRKIRVINDYLLFIKKEEMSDDKPMQGSYVETRLGIGGERTNIKVQGIIFPLLLQESIKGLFELFSSHGLPKDLKKAQYIVKKADFVLAEPWDLRFGVGLWKMIFGGVEDTNMIPYMFTSFVKIPTDEFNISVKEILSNTEKGNDIINSLMKNAEYDNGYQQFTNRINARNVDKSLIKDSYFTGAETNGFELGSETDDGDVIEEDWVEESASDKGKIEPNKEIIGILKNATVDNIDFIEGNVGKYDEEVTLTVDGIEIPSHLVRLDFRTVNKRFPKGKKELLNLDIDLNPKLRGFGLGTKIYAKAVREFGAICSRFSTRHNDLGIRGIFNKLNSFADIYVAEDVYQNLDGETINDYYAILKSELDKYIPLQENKYAKDNIQLITEGWAKDKRRIISRTVDILKNNIIGMSTYGAYKLEKDIEQTYFHGTMAGDGKIRKYEPMVANILTKELGYPNSPENEKETDFLKNVLIYIWNFQIRKGIKPNAVCSFEKGVVMDDFETIVSKYKPLLDELEAKGEDINFIGETNYEIIPIEDFETAKQYGNFSNPSLPLCYTQGRNTWDRYTKNGENKVFLCLNKKTWKNWRIGESPEDNDETPYDEYGLSMIWVFIDKGGNIAYSNTRWNHNMEIRIPDGGYGGKDVDHSFDGKSLERVLNMPFEKAFGVKLGEGFDYTKYVNEKLEKVNNELSSISDEFENNECALFDTSFRNIKRINVDNKCNFIKMNENNEIILLSPDVWFEYAPAEKEMNQVFPRILSVVRANGKFNIIDVDGNLLLPNNMWCDQIKNDRLNNGANGINVYVLRINNRYNCLGPDGNLLFDEWVVKIHPANNLKKVLFVIKNDASIEVFDENTNSFRSLNEIIEDYTISGKEITPSIAAYIDIDDDGKVTFCGHKNLIGNDGALINKMWFADIVQINENVSIVRVENVFNLIDNNTKELIYKKPLNDWFTQIIPFRSDDNHFRVEYNDKANILDINGNLLFQSDNLENWADEIDAFNLYTSSCNYLRIKCGNKYNILTEDFRLLWDAPKEKWFRYVYPINGGKNFLVTNEQNKENILTLEGNLVLNEPLDYFDENGGLNTYVIGIDGYYNFIRRDDFSLVYNAPLDEWFNEVFGFHKDKKLTTVIKNSCYNFLNIDGTLLFDDWFIVESRQMGLCSVVTAKNGLLNIVDRANGVLVSNQWFEKIDEVTRTDLLKCYVSKYEPTNLYYNYESGEFKAINGKAAMHDFEANPIDGSVEEYVYKHFGVDCMVQTFIEGKLYRIREYIHDGNEKIENLLSIEGGKPRFLLPKWVGRIGRPLGNVVSVTISDTSRYDENDTKNLFNLETESYVFNYLVDAIDYERDEGVIDVYKDDNSMNMVEGNGNVVFENWVENIQSTSFDKIYKVKYDGKYNMYDLNSHRFLANQFYDDISFLCLPSREGEVSAQTSNVCAVSRKGQNGLDEHNLLDKDGELLFDNWHDVIVLTTDDSCSICVIMDDIYLSPRDIKMNFANVNTGELISDEPIRLDSTFHIGKAKKQGKINFVDNRGHILLPQWADSASNLDNRGFITVTYGNENRLYRANDGKLELVEQEGSAKIPSDFTFCNRNQVDLMNHILRYELIGWREGRSEHTTTYNQKVTVILKDGNNTSRSRIYVQRGDESCTWTMYSVYEALCRELGIKPASVE